MANFSYFRGNYFHQELNIKQKRNIMEGQNVLEVSESVKWIGVLDRDIVTFDIVMETKFGTTYNSYFINADKKAVVETVKEKFAGEFIEKIKSLTNPEEIEYIICNHTEPDHSGSVKHLLKICPNATVLGSGQAINYLNEIIDESFKSQKVKGGDVIDMGNKKLKVIGAPNLHWPDSIYTYLEEEQVLFTCDSFGAHYCDEKMYDDLVGDYQEAFDYYFDVILKPYSKFMLKAIEKIKDLDIKVVCPGHGPILRSTWQQAVERSEKLSKEYLANSAPDCKNVLITYVSAYGYTREMANHIASGIEMAGGVGVELVDIENIQLGELESKVVQAGALLVGSPTINQNTLLQVYKLFAIINPIRDKGKLAASFGSYGWSGEAVKIIEDQLRNLKLDVVEQGMSTKFFPHAEKSTQLVEFGKKFAEKVKNNGAAK